MTRIILIRHAESVLNVSNRIYGPKDQNVPLTLTGSRQASHLRKHLAKENIGTAYSSPARRTKDTAMLAGIPKRKNKIIPALEDRRMGTTDSEQWHAIYANNPRIVAALRHHKDFMFPGGESMKNVENRVMPIIKTIIKKHPKGTIAVFTHADVIRNIIGNVLKVPYGMRRYIAIPNASRTIIESDTDIVRKGIRVTVIAGVGLPPL